MKNNIRKYFLNISDNSRTMHDFMLAKEIVDNVLAIAKEKNLTEIKSVSLEIGNVVLAHDGFPEHAEEISLENLEFGLKGIAKNTILKNTEFRIEKATGSYWRITNVEV